ncbi:MAG: AAA family ATPase [Bacteroidales bacterium]|nr:AAA family ATPase [Bacteroidales bacterium]
MLALFFFARPLYKSSSRILITPSLTENGFSSVAAELNSVGNTSFFSSFQDLYYLFRSSELIDIVVSGMNLDKEYRDANSFRKPILYGRNQPFSLELLNLGPEDEFRARIFKLDGHSVRIVSGKDDKAVALGDTAVVNGAVLVPRMESGWDSCPEEVIFRKTDYFSVLDRCISRWDVVPMDKDVFGFDLSYKDESQERASDVILAVLDAYADFNRKAKAEGVEKSDRMLMDRLADVGSKLGIVDDNITSYKSSNLVLDVRKKGTISFRDGFAANSEIEDLEFEGEMLLYMLGQIDSCRTNGLTTLLPTLVPVESGNSLYRTVDDFNDKLLIRNRLIASGGIKSKVSVDLYAQLEELLESIEAGINTRLSSIDASVYNLESMSGKVEKALRTDPKHESYLRSERMRQQFLQGTYIYLSKMLEENRIASHFYANAIRVIQSPSGSGIPFFPSRRFLVLLFLGIAVCPVLLFYLYSRLLDDRVFSVKELRCFGINPVATLKENPDQKEIDSLSDKVYSLGYDNPTTVFGVVSVNVGSGKSYISRIVSENLAAHGENVVLVDCDLRKGTVSAQFQELSEVKNALASYLANSSAGNLDTIIYKVGNLDVIPVGDLPANPAEIISSPAFDAFVNELRKRYKFIILDCPPINIIADTMEVSRALDKTLFVIRAGLFRRFLFEDVTEVIRNQSLPGLHFIFNGLKR